MVCNHHSFIHLFRSQSPRGIPNIQRFNHPIFKSLSPTNTTLIILISYLTSLNHSSSTKNSKKTWVRVKQNLGKMVIPSCCSNKKYKPPLHLSIPSRPWSVLPWMAPHVVWRWPPYGSFVAPQSHPLFPRTSGKTAKWEDHLMEPKKNLNFLVNLSISSWRQEVNDHLHKRQTRSQFHAYYYSHSWSYSSSHTWIA